MVTLNGLLLGLFLLMMGAASACRAQAVPARADTASAIKRLFRLRRQGMEEGVGLAGGCGTVAPGAAATTTPAEGSRMMLPPTATAGLGTNCSLHQFFVLLRFSPRREQQVLLLLARHRPLPPYVRRSLGPVLASK